MRRLADFIARLRGSLTKNDVESRLDEEIGFHLDMHAQREIEPAPIPTARGATQPSHSADVKLARSGARRIPSSTSRGRSAGPPLRRSDAPKVARIHWRRAPHVRARHRREHRGVQRCQRNSPPSTAVRESRPARVIWPAKTISNAELVYLQRHTRRSRSVAAFSPGWGIALTGAGDPRQLDAARVSTNYFQTLGVRPAVGRPFAPGEIISGQWNVAVISHALWLSQFGGDSSVIGRVVQMDDTPTQIVGVMPAGFEAFQANVDAWLPLQIDPSSPFYTGQTALGFGATRSRRIAGLGHR